VFTGDSAASNPRLWSGHPEAVQIVVRQSVEKIFNHSVTNQMLGALPIIFFIENIGFSQVSNRLSARKSVRTYYVLNDVKKHRPQVAE
jgi:hypothetical protein